MTPRTMTVRWPYHDLPDIGAPVRFGKKLLGHVTAIHQPGDPSDDTALEITLADAANLSPRRDHLKGLSL